MPGAAKGHAVGSPRAYIVGAGMAFVMTALTCSMELPYKKQFCLTHNPAWMHACGILT